MNEEMQAQAQAQLFAKLARVMGRVRNLEKTGFNQHFKYKFVTDGAVSNAISTELAKENVAFIPSILESRNDGKITYTRFLMTFACGDTGAVFQAMWEGEGMDNQDKGVSKSATSAVKYFLLKTFLIDTGERADDPDNDSALDKGNKGKRDEKPAQPKTQPPAPTNPSATQQPLEGATPTFDDETGESFMAWITNELDMTTTDAYAALGNASGDIALHSVTEWTHGYFAATAAVLAFKMSYAGDKIAAFIGNVKRNQGAGFRNQAGGQFKPAELEQIRTLALKLVK